MLNKVVLIGRLTRDPELRFTPTNGTAVASFTLAVGRMNGKDETDFIDIVVWNKQAESCAQYLSKGKLAAVAGRLQIRSYEAKDGTKRRVAEVVAETVQFLSPRGSNEPGPRSDFDEFPKEINLEDEEVPF